MNVSVKQNLSNSKINFGGHFCTSSWVVSSLDRERRSNCGFRRQSQHSRAQPVSMQDGHTNTIYNKHLNTVVLHLVKACTA